MSQTRVDVRFLPAKLEPVRSAHLPPFPQLDERGKGFVFPGALDIDPDPEASADDLEYLDEFAGYLSKMRRAIASVSGLTRKGVRWTLVDPDPPFQVSLLHSFFVFGERKDGSESWEKFDGPARWPSQVLEGRMPDNLGFAFLILESYNLMFYAAARDVFKSHGIERAVLTSVLVERFSTEEEKKKHALRRSGRSSELLKRAKSDPRSLFGKRLHRGQKLVLKTKNRKVTEVLRVERRRLGNTTELVLIRRKLQKDGKTYKPGFGQIVGRKPKKKTTRRMGRK